MKILSYINLYPVPVNIKQNTKLGIKPTQGTQRKITYKQIIREYFIRSLIIIYV